MSRWQDVPLLQTLVNLDIPPDKLDQVLEELHDCVADCEDGGIENVKLAIDGLQDDRAYEALITSLQSKSQSDNGESSTKTQHVDANVSNHHRPAWSYQLATTLTSHGSHVVSLYMCLSHLVAADLSQMENCTAWCSFIQKSNLKNIDVFWDTYAIVRAFGGAGNLDIPALGTSLFKALSACIDLEIVQFSGNNKLPMKCFGTFLSEAKIRRLDVCSSVLDELDYSSFSEAVGSSQTLETVDLRIERQKESSLLPQLAMIPCLKEANLSFGFVNELEYGSDLVRLLEQSTALCRLTLTSVRFSRELMDTFVTAMEGRPGMTKLTLNMCTYPDATYRKLFKYLQTCSLKEFGFGMHSRSFPTLDGFQIEALAGLLFQPSTLQAVRFTRLGCIDSDLTEWLIANAAKIRVKALRFYVHQYVFPTWLLTCIERFRHVRDLQVVTSQNPTFAFEDIKHAVKNNTSLRRISIMKEHDWDDERLCPALTRSQEKVLAAFCQRNESLPALLASHEGDSVFPLLLTAVGDAPPTSGLTFLQGSSALCAHDDHNGASSTSLRSRRGKKRSLSLPH